MIADSINAALGGMQRNQDAFARHAHRIANAGTAPAEGNPGVNLQDEMVGVLVSRRGWEANLPVLRAADEMLGSLLDVLA
ncbi:MAG: hypothetical protein IPO18_18900 [bacterium]|nr:hypothetical protein [bacterium]MBK9474306.1 hypothetical protein [bacterium]